MKQASDARLILGESLMFLLAIVINAFVISRWLPPLASAVTSGILSVLVIGPIVYPWKLVSGRRLFFSVLMLTALIYLLSKID
jgi:hypothetical protein